MGHISKFNENISYVELPPYIKDIFNLAIDDGHKVEVYHTWTFMDNIALCIYSNNDRTEPIELQNSKFLELVDGIVNRLNHIDSDLIKETQVSVYASKTVHFSSGGYNTNSLLSPAESWDEILHKNYSRTIYSIQITLAL